MATIEPVMATALQQHQQQQSHAPPPTEALVAALQRRDNQLPPVHRRLLRFVFGGLARKQGQQGSTGDEHRQKKRRGEWELQDQLQGDSVCGCSDDLTEETSEDVLGMSPFASCADLQDYRQHLQQRRQERELRQRLDQERQQQQQAGPARRLLQWLVHGVRSLSRHVSPQGEGNNDATLSERVFNVVTSVPFVLVGLHSLRSPGAARRRFGASFIGTGVIAALYHATSGGARKVLRKLDYYSIAFTSGVLRSATGAHVPMAINALAALVTPLKPTLVTAANLAIIEARYLTSALKHAHLRQIFGVHLGMAATGVGCFLLEDLLVMEMGAPPVFHSLWHTLSALSLGLIGPLLSHCEGALLLEGVQMVVAGSA